MAVSLQGIRPELVAIIQDRTLERVFKDALYPRLLFRSECRPESWQANIGERMVFTRTGLLPPSTKPLAPGSDPSPKTYNFEQWEAEARQFGDAIDTHMPSSRVALAPKFLRDTHTLGLSAGETMNQLARNSLYRAYLAGNTVADQAANSGATSLHVASINGFAETIDANGRPVAVSTANPINVSFAGTADDNTVVGAVPDDPDDPLGPGTLTLGTALSAGVARREAVLAANRSIIRRVGGGDSIDALGATDVLALDDIIAAVSLLRANKVPPHSDGYYHCHISPQGVAQLYQDNHWQRLHQSLPDSEAYRDLAIGRAVRCNHYENTENPDELNSGDLVATGGGVGDAECAPDIGGEVRNDNGDVVRRVMITGGGACYEKFVDESDYITEAGVTGKIGEFTVVNNGVQVMTERIRYILRAPLDRLQQVVGQAWSWTGDFPVPSDALSGGPARFKRAVVIEHFG